ncbi:hypothetical protein KRE42_08535 [Elizabethkingia meningoseptica]|uniref:hypothetical protein n=1 Tax=Elizabethkingia meningoseptica TaxID=238 RepID=UPI0023B06550|nr:hypothetical protein [Elizabethkingia meningoseptica]MDE5537118.1 hypothetical protein [Elizabethkingia meningoseptica]
MKKMINNLIGLGTILLGATMAKKGTVRFFESSTYSDFEITDRIVDSIRVFESGSNVYEKAYNLQGEYLDKGKVYKRYTIGNGMTYLFKEGGVPYVTNYPSKGSNAVRSNDTLTALKSVMGYSDLSSSDFAKKLTENFAKAASYSRVAKDLDRLGVPFHSNYAEALMEMSYGSGSAFQLTSGLYNLFLTSVKTDSSPYNFARSYFNYRYSYYKSLNSAWAINKNGWMPRIFFASMIAKGENIDAMQTKNKYYHTNTKYLENKSLLMRDIQREFGYNVVW